MAPDKDSHLRPLEIHACLLKIVVHVNDAFRFLLVKNTRDSFDDYILGQIISDEFNLM